MTMLLRFFVMLGTGTRYLNFSGCGLADRDLIHAAESFLHLRQGVDRRCQAAMR